MLTERQKLILHAIVEDYIKSAEPVGSRTISKRGDIGFSPATIRNEMSDLEDLGYLEQPHTSAGRIPSNKGYRYYVDHLVQGHFPREELKLAKKFFAERIQHTEQIMQQAASILSGLTNYTAIALGAESLHNSLKHIQLIPINEDRAVAIIVTDRGHVESKTVSIPEDVPMNELERFVNFLNDKLQGVPLLKLRSRLYNEIGSELERHVSRYHELLQMIDQVLDTNQEEKLYLSGMTNMLSQPEFRDVEKAKTILDLFDESVTLARMFAGHPGGIQVRIGTENPLEAMQHCSLVTASYTVDGQLIGTIGVLGPTRMDYAKVIGLLEMLTTEMNDIISKWYK